MILVELGTVGTLHPQPRQFNTKITGENSLFLLSKSAMFALVKMSKLLLIDDEEDVRYSFQRIFDGHGIEW